MTADSARTHTCFRLNQQQKKKQIQATSAPSKTRPPPHLDHPSNETKYTATVLWQDPDYTQKVQNDADSSWTA